MNAYVAHANPKIFGEDPEVFRPERWLQDSETVRQMENYFLTVRLPLILLLAPSTFSLQK